MNESRATEILTEYIGTGRPPNGFCSNANLGWISVAFYDDLPVEENTASLDGNYTAEQLKAIVWWMENKHD